MGATIVLETEKLGRRFGAHAAVEDLSLRVRQGEIYGFLGPNGAGKTTTIRMIAGLLRPTEGEVRVLGEPVRVDDAKARRSLGLCPQENVMYPDLTARENLEYAAALFGVPRAVRRARADEILTQLDLADKAKSRASALSGGMKRRLTIGLAIVHDPPVVIFDEPEAGLDPQTRVAVREFIHSLRAEKTVILTSHNMDEVERLADRVAIIDHGRLVEEGAPSDLKSKLGGGDAMELTLSGAAASGADALRALGLTVTGETRLVVRGSDLPRRFAAILDALANAGAGVEDVRYRGATLEDVFISLTGRGLRE